MCKCIYSGQEANSIKHPQLPTMGQFVSYGQYNRWSYFDSTTQKLSI